MHLRLHCGHPAPTPLLDERFDDPDQDICHDEKHAEAGDIDGLLLLDADLAILGAEPETYARYARRIRAEYAWVTDEVYRAGRLTVLRQFLARQHIYHTAQYQRLESQVRLNLEREIAILAAPEK